METLRKSHLNLCIYVGDCAASTHKNTFVIYLP